jgi:putative ABC transport system permease protein
LILLIATANYLNLSTARFLERAREVGVRKALGASKGQLRTQFMFESGLVTLLSFASSLVLFTVLSPFFFGWLALPRLGLDVRTVLITVALFIGAGLLSSLYPAVVLPALHPVAALKGKHAWPASRFSLPKLLVVGQFGITITLVVFTVMAYRQLGFMQEQALGVDISGTMVVYGPMGLKWDKQLSQRIESFGDEATKLTGVRKAGSSRYVPGDAMERVGDARLKGSSERVTLATGWVDSPFFDVYGMQLLAGRFLLPTDSSRVVLNASAARRLGFSNLEDAIGKRIQFWGGNWEGEVVGVVNDHHQQSLHHPIEPIAFSIVRGGAQDGYFSLKVSAQNLLRTIGQVERPCTRPYSREPLSSTYSWRSTLTRPTGRITGCAGSWVFLPPAPSLSPVWGYGEWYSTQ